MTPKIIWDSIYDFFHENLLIKPKAFMRLCKNKELYNDESYFPSAHHNSSFINFLRQFRQILKYNSPEDYFFLYGWDTKTLNECDSYVNYIEFYKTRTKLNHSNPCYDSTCILYNKLYFGAFARSMGMPVAEDVAYIENSKMYLLLPQMHEVSFSELLNLESGNYFVKSLSGENGDNIFKIKIYEKQIYYKDRFIKLDDFIHLTSNYKYIVQKQIKQHPKMDELYSKSVNTLRIFTVRSIKDNLLYTLPSIVRIGSGGSYIDNGSKGGIMVGVNLETGELYSYGLLKPEYGRIAYKHPDTLVEFKGFKIPYIKECVEACKCFHDLFPDIHSIGWDVVVTENGPLFIEGNDNWEIEVPQMYRGIRKEFDEYFYNK